MIPRKNHFWFLVVICGNGDSNFLVMRNAVHLRTLLPSKHFRKLSTATFVDAARVNPDIIPNRTS
ncbi:hypothetical protein M7I_2734 [Glarea lozoyensis 74030]|uniref:Uncharacterized protein n=1 Tax=Glarea lozoyensis (strain ATCC 74030 / MF5533) TaxID=1104152 RepID=H0EJK6_GLAL7|nr:hypothetical protein M7I_2734 [Glarea lozoyensis 74030]